MLKFFLLGLASIGLSLPLVACDERDNHEEATTLNFYLVNDLHGALLPGPGQMGMARIGNFLLDEKQSHPESTIILAGGDMLQGTLISNYFHGENTVQIMDAAGFDAAVVGNHEFDWGLEAVTRYYTGDENAYQAEHPFLACNIFFAGTEDIPEGIQPYTVIQRSGLNIGIIGAIGYGLESSIIASAVEGYAFADPVPLAGKYAAYLRTEKDADVVVLLTHDSGTTENQMNARVAAFEGNQRIDAIFNGHLHNVATDLINGVPAILSGHSGNHIGHLQLTIENGRVIGSSTRNLTAESDERLNTAHPDIEALIDESKQHVAHLYEPALTADGDQTRQQLSEWMCRLILKTTGADFAFQNRGGVRHSINDGEDVSLATLYAVFPFDNTVVTAKVSGSTVENLIRSNDHASTIDPGDIDPEAIYTIATNNYTFDHPALNLNAGEDIRRKPLELFDLATGAYHYMADSGEHFNTATPIDPESLAQWLEREEAAAR